MTRTDLALLAAVALGLSGWGIYAGMTGSDLLPAHADRGCPPAHAAQEPQP